MPVQNCSVACTKLLRIYEVAYSTFVVALSVHGVRLPVALRIGCVRFGPNLSTKTISSMNESVRVWLSVGRQSGCLVRATVPDPLQYLTRFENLRYTVP